MLTFKQHIKKQSLNESWLDAIKSSMRSRSVARDRPHIDSWIGNHMEDNAHLVKGHREENGPEGRRAGAAFAAIHKPVRATPEEHEAVGYYASHDEGVNSLPLNRTLKRGEQPTGRLAQTKKRLESLISKNPAPHEYHAYSGLSYDPEKLKDESGHVNLPHFSSLTTSRSQGHSYSTRLWKKPEEQPVVHVARIKVNKGAPVTAAHRDESEIIMGPGKLKHNGYKEYHDGMGRVVRVHEMETT